GYRAIYDLSDLRQSRFVIATGQSGNPFSRHYNDQLNDWLEGRSVSLSPAVASLKSANAPTLVLKPAAAR
ncbi:MAG TPA: penicillin acylase family protein, partial [Rhodospirillales bacterium]